MKPNQWSQNDNRKLVKSSQVKSKKKKKSHTLWKKPSLLVYSLVPTTKSHRFFKNGFRKQSYRFPVWARKEYIYPIMKDSTNIEVMKVILRSGICLSGKIATQCLVKVWKLLHNENRKGIPVLPTKKWKLFSILIFRVYLLWVQQYFHWN